MPKLMTKSELIEKITAGDLEKLPPIGRRPEFTCE
jgi:hypothetical protein